MANRKAWIRDKMPYKFGPTQKFGVSRKPLFVKNNGKPFLEFPSDEFLASNYFRNRIGGNILKIM